MNRGESKRIELKHGDCLELMKDIPDKSIDCIITDPPYRVTSRGNCGNMGGFWKNELSAKGKIFKYNNIKCKDYLSEFYRVLKESTLCFVMCNNVNLQEIINEGTLCGFHFVKCLIWEKGKKICGRYFMNCFEYIVLFRKGGDRQINNCSTPDILHIPVNKLKDNEGHNLHDTEKPVELMKVLVENGSNEGDTVLEPFMGIGSTVLACKELNRNAIGFEIDDKYFNIANKRVKETNKMIQQELF